MCPFVPRVKHNPCLMPGQSHCSHTESHSTPAPALEQLARWCHLKLSAVSVVNHRLDQQLSRTAGALTALSSPAQSIRRVGWRQKKYMAFQVCRRSPMSSLWINTDWLLFPKDKKPCWLALMKNTGTIWLLTFIFFLLFLWTKTDQKMSETHVAVCTEHKAYWFGYSNNVLFSSKASYRNPESRVIVKERLLWQDVWIIETWKKEQKVHLDGLYNSYITRLNCLRISYCLL